MKESETATSTLSKRRTTPKADEAGSNSVRSEAAQKAYQRRDRRTAKVRAEKISVGLGDFSGTLPAKLTARRVPFVAFLVALLGAGLAGVLWLNTMTDEAGLQENKSNKTSESLRLEVEALNRQIADLNATPAIAEAAKGLGLVPAGDSAILVIDPDAGVQVIGTPTPVPDPVVVAADAAAARAAAQAAATAQAAADAQAAVDAQVAAQAAVDAQAAADSQAAVDAQAAAAAQAAADAAAQSGVAPTPPAEPPVPAQTSAAEPPATEGAAG